MKVWQTEYFALNFATGEMERAISDMYFEGVNFEQAQLSLVRSKKTWLRLTGNWFRSKKDVFTVEEASSEQIEKLESGYDNIIKPEVLVKDMSVDDFLDWLNLTDDLKDILSTLERFRGSTADGKYARLIIGHLKHKYNYEEN